MFIASVLDWVGEVCNLAGLALTIGSKQAQVTY